MYSREIFPRYTDGGMPIPEGYSGNAVRRAPPPSQSRDAVRTGASREQPSVSREQPQTRMSARAAEGLRRSAGAPCRAQTSPMQTDAQEMSAPPQTGAGLNEPTPVKEAPPAQTAERPMETSGMSETSSAVSVSAGAHEKPDAPSQKDGGMAAILSALLPPKPAGGGALSHIGLEEALLLGLFLLLSQSDEEEDTLMLLALLFLYR